MTEYSRDSTFNMGIAHLTRIDNLLCLVAQSSAENDYPNWFESLNLLSREVFFLFDPEEMEMGVNLQNACARAINEFNNKRSFECKQEAYNKLVDYEYFLKKQLAERKMLMAFSKDLRVSISDLG